MQCVFLNSNPITLCLELSYLSVYFEEKKFAEDYIISFIDEVKAYPTFLSVISLIFCVFACFVAIFKDQLLLWYLTNLTNFTVVKEKEIDEYLKMKTVRIYLVYRSNTKFKYTDLDRIPFEEIRQEVINILDTDLELQKVIRHEKKLRCIFYFEIIACIAFCFSFFVSAVATLCLMTNNDGLNDFLPVSITFSACCVLTLVMAVKKYYLNK